MPRDGFLWIFRLNQVISFHLIITNDALVPHRMAEVGRLSASAKNAFNSFVGPVFAFFVFFSSRNTKVAIKKVVFYLVYLVFT